MAPGSDRHQHGAAVLMALFITALATVIVTGLFWRQFVVLRMVENQQILAQNHLLLRGALDWARAILREDARVTTVDTLDEPWAKGLDETRLDSLGETSLWASQATMAGSIEDAQARLNLRNLVAADGTLVPREVAALRRLVTLLGAPPQTADLIAERMRTSLPPAAVAAASSGSTADSSASGATGEATARPIPLVWNEDLAGVAGIDPNVARVLMPYVVVLDAPTPVNFNTAPAEVIAARIQDLGLSDAKALTAERAGGLWFRDTADILNRLRGRGTDVQSTDMAVSSRYFIVHGQIRLQRATTRLDALVHRAPPGIAGPVDVLWIHEPA